MTQSSVLKLLEKNKKRCMTTKEISKKLGINGSSVSSNLNRLYNQGFIYKSIVKIGHRNINLWRFK